VLHPELNSPSEAAVAIPKCWAVCLGDCDGGITGEHTVSKCLLPSGGVTVRGLHWCAQEPVTVGIASLTQNILCKKHNNDLSEVDAYAKIAFETLAASMELNDLRNRLRQDHWAIKRFEVDGPLFERWFVKTLVNVTFKGQYGIGRNSILAGVPSDELVRIAFGRQSFEGYGGLHALAHTGENIELKQGVSITTMLEDSNVVMARFSFCGFRYLLSLIPEKYSHHDESVLLHHGHRQYFQVHDSRGRKIRSHIVEFKW
jgi:hypothetical protein